ncbi:hypothetical protein PR048_014656 [Dryococelus australis]|uniref:Uncharacterized protein n=1 Tax=Dryococelus australis TaxID=614101 RepID=A0ABQ9HEU5_9NEOP|nr:hypothetical protein PR048_014656 [Dryococelus australis]
MRHSSTSTRPDLDLKALQLRDHSAQFKCAICLRAERARRVTTQKAASPRTECNTTWPRKAIFLIGGNVLEACSKPSEKLTAIRVEFCGCRSRWLSHTDYLRALAYLSMNTRATRVRCWQKISSRQHTFALGISQARSFVEACKTDVRSTQRRRRENRWTRRLPPLTTKEKAEERGILEVPEKTHRLAASSGTISTGENLDGCRGGVVVRLLASHRCEPGSIPWIYACRNRAGRCDWLAGFLGDVPFPPLLHSGAAPYSPRFTLISSQDLDVKSHPNLFTHSMQPANLVTWGTGEKVVKWGKGYRVGSGRGELLSLSRIRGRSFQSDPGQKFPEHEVGLKCRLVRSAGERCFSSLRCCAWRWRGGPVYRMRQCGCSRG